MKGGQRGQRQAANLMAKEPARKELTRAHACAWDFVSAGGFDLSVLSELERELAMEFREFLEQSRGEG